MTDIREMSKEDLSLVMEELGEPKFRANQLHEWIHKHGVSDYDKMTNLSKTLREKLQKEYPLTPTQPVTVDLSQDGTRKYLLQTQKAVVETVGIPIAFDEKKSRIKRLTVCFSTQAGCSMGCTFCATGRQGFSRNLTASEMVDQILTVQNDFGARVDNVVAMGQGEPFLNYENTLAALRRINTDPSLGIGARKITVSTCGIIDGIKRFGREPEQFRLAVSLHSAKQRIRDELMPRCAGQNLNDLQEVLVDYNLQSGRRVTLEYMLIAGVNDSDADMDALAAFCDGINCHVNLIPLNHIDESPYKPASRSTVKKWVTHLNAVLIPTSIRNSRGSDINGACGQLREKLSSPNYSVQ